MTVQALRQAIDILREWNAQAETNTRGIELSDPTPGARDLLAAASYGRKAMVLLLEAEKALLR